MINIKSNINDFIKRFDNRIKKVNNSLENIAYRIAQEMSNDMMREISLNRFVWLQQGSELENIGAIDFNILKTGNNSVIVSIGESLPKIRVGESVSSKKRGQPIQDINPMFFVEFGFGIIGEQRPKNTMSYEWEYNINDRNNSWYFKGRFDELYKTSGGEGINFMFNTIIKYRNKWKEIVMREIKEAF